MCIPASGHISEHQNRCLQPPSWTDRPQPDGIGIGIGIRSHGPTSAHSSAPCTLRAPLSCSDNLSRVEKVSPYIRLLASISHDALQLIFIFSILSRFICPQQDLLILQNPPDSGLQSQAESATYCPSACQPHFYRLWGGWRRNHQTSDAECFHESVWVGSSRRHRGREKVIQRGHNGH